MIGMTHAEFWRHTPAECAERLVAAKRLRNQVLLVKAWEVYNLLTPHMDDQKRGGVSYLDFFRSIPTVDTSLEAWLPAATAKSGRPAGMTERQYQEFERRLKRRRVTPNGQQ